MAINTGVGSPGTVAAASGGKVTAINALGVGPITVIAGNPQRVSITFHNPSAISVYVAPLITATGASLVPALPNTLGGCFQIFPGGLLVVTGECQVGWQAFAASGSTAALTIMESNV